VKVTNEKTENSQTYLTIEMEPAEVEEGLEKSYHRLVQRAKVPGFRKGKAPRVIFERYFGRESLLEEAIETLVPEAYEKAIKEQVIEPIARPQIEVTQKEPLIFKAVVPLKPKVKLDDYHSIRLSPESVSVSDDDINTVFEGLRHQHANWEPVERPVQLGDSVVMDIWSNTDGQPFINQKGLQYQVLKDVPFPGFGDQIVGMKKDEEKEFKLTLPADYPRSELAGKEPQFKVRVNEIKQEILPELNDDLAKQVNPEVKDLAELREKILAELKARAEERARIEFEEKVIDAVVVQAQVEFPPVLVEAELQRLLDQRFRGQQELEAYLKNFNKTEEQLHEELHPIANKRVTRSLVLGQVVEDEKIEVSQTEIDAEAKRLVDGTTENNKDKMEKFLATPEARESMEQSLLTRKTIERLVDIARGSGETIIREKKEGEK
jgi:trigger factor